MIHRKLLDLSYQKYFEQREREKRDRYTDRETERQIERERVSHIQTDRQTEIVKVVLLQIYNCN